MSCICKGILLCSLIWMLQEANGKQNEMMYGKCELYSGTTCREFLKGKKIYMKRYMDQRVLETRVSTWLRTARGTKSVSSGCWPHAKALICFHIFPQCSSSRVMPSNRPFCQDECKYLESHVCRKEFLLARSISAIKHYVPECRNLPQPGTRQYANCRKLPSLAESKYRRGLFVVYQKNCTASQTERAALKCYFMSNNLGKTSQNPIKITWYRDGEGILKRSGRYRIKRRKRGEFRVISTLIIKSVALSDVGHYRCVAKQGKKSVQSGVFLKVVKKRKQTREEKAALRSKKKKFKFSEMGRCVPYKGSACAKYLTKGEDSYIFEYKYSPQSSVENGLINEFRKLDDTGTFSDKCKDLARAVMCHNVFNACNKSASSSASRLCQDDCYLFDRVHCKHEVEMARKHSSVFEYLPDCSMLQAKNSLCKPIDSPLINPKRPGENDTQCYTGVGQDYSGQVNVSRTGKNCKPWENFSPVYKFKHNYCRNYGGENFAPWCFVGNGEKEFCAIPRCSKSASLDIKTPESGEECFTGIGENYHGLVKVSKSDRLCLRWSMMGPYAARHNYCRNYGGTKSAPWCFVAKKVTEYCNVPRCLSAAKSTAENKSPSLVYYVIPVAIALSVLLLVVLVLLVYLKHRKKENPSSPSVQTSRDRSQSAGPVEQEGTQEPHLPGSLDKRAPAVDDSMINYLELVGKGCFIEIWKAELIEPDDYTTPLLVKRLITDASDDLLDTFRREVKYMRGLSHRNVVDIAYVSCLDDVPFLAFEVGNVCDLKYCLQAGASRMNKCKKYECMNYDALIDIAAQICSGMEYLTHNSILHMDLGTRNCLISGNYIVKIAHFGLGYYTHPEDYYCGNSVPLPVRWMSPESLRTKKFTKENDVWSYGVLVWELVSYASTPYSRLDDRQAIAAILRYELLTCPEECPASLYSLMKECWAAEPYERLTFPEINERLACWSRTAC